MGRLFGVLAMVVFLVGATREAGPPTTPSTASNGGLAGAQPSEEVLLLRARSAEVELEESLSARGRVPSRVPNYPGRMADPAILVEGTTYYAYGTRAAQLDIPALASVDLVHWSQPVNALPTPPAWAERGRTWAPSVVRRGESYVMWYTTRDRAAARQCISFATASQPLGPFVDTTTGPTICQLDRGGSIDPDVFIDGGGAAYLVWKSEDNTAGQYTSLWGATLDESGTRLGPYTLLLSRSAEWQGLIIEGPALTRGPDGYLLFYGANNWASTAASIGYARCAMPLGPCAEASPHEPWLAGDATVLGPAGPQFFRDASGVTRMAYHAFDQCIGGPRCPRSLFIDRLAFIEGRPLLGAHRPAR